jgi:amino acid adenylation domain-containing protein
MSPAASRPLLLHHMIDEAALRQPNAPAARCDGATLSYEQLARRAYGLSRVLLASGLQPRDRVGVLLQKGLGVPVGFYGTLAAGATLVPIDPRSPVEQVARILRATGATHLVTEPDRRDAARRALATCPSVSHVIGLEPGDDLAVPCTPWAVVEGEASDRPPATRTIELDPAYILHTSGSTGIPKLILHTHHSAMSFVDWAVSEYSLTGDDRLSNHSSHHTCFATFDYYAAARVGATTVILTPAALMLPASLSQVLERERVTVWYSVPTALVQLSLRGELESRDLGALRWVLFAGETFPAKHLLRIMRQLPGARFSHVYGSTEVNVCTYYHLPMPDALTGPLPIGTACSTASTVVVDDDLRPLGVGEVGELLVRGSTVMSGYWGEPERNDQVLVRLTAAGGLGEVHFRTGDRVRTLDDGTLVFVARDDRQVKVRGHRVELAEVETALLSLPDVEEAHVFTAPDGEGSLAIQAAVVVEDGHATDQREILAGLRGLLPPYALPAEVSVLDSFPRTPTGKVDGNALRARVTTGEAARGH